jgi:hypothetical protein
MKKAKCCTGIGVDVRYEDWAGSDKKGGQVWKSKTFIEQVPTKPHTACPALHGTQQVAF